jgi:hypothetical protein
MKRVGDRPETAAGVLKEPVATFLLGLSLCRAPLLIGALRHRVVMRLLESCEAWTRRLAASSRQSA